MRNVKKIVAGALLFLSFFIGEKSILASAVSPSPIPQVTQTASPIEGYESLFGDVLVKSGETGDDVLLVQQRLMDLGYYPYKVTGVFGPMTKDSVMYFQKENGLEVDGVVGGKTASLLFSNYAERQLTNTMRQATPVPTKRPDGVNTSAPKYGKLIEWKDVNGKVARWGGTFTIVDYYTRVEYKCKRVGGYNHMDFEPINATATKRMKSTYGGSWSWGRRPVLVKIGSTWYAGSVNGMPHGYETVSGNGMNGQVCLHFLNSRTHGTAIIDRDHQSCIRKAAGK